MLMYMGVATSFKKERITIPFLQDRRWTATDAIEDGYSFSLFTYSYGSVKLKLLNEQCDVYFLIFVINSTVNRRIDIGTATY